jgi:hypothetical protein
LTQNNATEDACLDMLSTAQPQNQPQTYLLKYGFEERVKNALQYDLSFESPLVYVQRFFNCAFSQSQQQS